jgi:hypothetical protein
MRSASGWLPLLLNVHSRNQSSYIDNRPIGIFLWMKGLQHRSYFMDDLYALEGGSCATACQNKHHRRKQREEKSASRRSLAKKLRTISKDEPRNGANAGTRRPLQIRPRGYLRRPCMESPAICRRLSVSRPYQKAEAEIAAGG